MRLCLIYACNSRNLEYRVLCDGIICFIQSKETKIKAPTFSRFVAPGGGGGVSKKGFKGVTWTWTSRAASARAVLQKESNSLLCVLINFVRAARIWGTFLPTVEIVEAKTVQITYEEKSKKISLTVNYLRLKPDKISLWLQSKAFWRFCKSSVWSLSRECNTNADTYCWSLLVQIIVEQKFRIIRIRASRDGINVEYLNDFSFR